MSSYNASENLPDECNDIVLFVGGCVLLRGARWLLIGCRLLLLLAWILMVVGCVCDFGLLLAVVGVWVYLSID